MKITDVGCLILDQQFRLTRVHTDEGMLGNGECFRRQPRLVKFVIADRLKPVLIGQDPVDTEVRWREMVRAASTVGTGAQLNVCAAYDNIPYAQKHNIELHSVRDQGPVMQVPLQVRGGNLEVLHGLGLGIELDDDGVNRLAWL